MQWNLQHIFALIGFVKYIVSQIVVSQVLIITIAV